MKDTERITLQDEIGTNFINQKGWSIEAGIAGTVIVLS